MFEKILAFFKSDVGKIVDNLTTTKEEKLKLNNDLGEVMLKYFTTSKELLSLEMQGSALQRNWRPLLMLSFGFIVMYEYFFQPAFGSTLGLQPVHTDERFWSLLEIGIGGYVIGRSFEKVTESIVKNVDLTLKKKKD